jgi:hypothetical protein
MARVVVRDVRHDRQAQSPHITERDERFAAEQCAFWGRYM